MSKCPSCGADVADGMKFCCECGARVPQDLECPACHAQSPIGTKFCPECGHRLSGTATEAVSSSSGDSKLAGDSFRHGVACHICGRQMSIIEANTCIDCHQYACNEHYDKAAHKCQSCLNGNDEDALENESASAAADEESQVENDEEEEDSSSGGHYSVVLKEAADNQGAMLRDLVEMTGKRLWPDIADMVSNLPAVVAEGLARDEANKYALALMLDGAKAEVVADDDSDEDAYHDDCDDDSDDGDDDWDDNDSDEGASNEEDSSSNGFYSVVLKKCKSIDNMVIYGREIYKKLGYDAYDFRKFISTPHAVLARKVSREEADKIVSTLGKYGILETIPDDIGDI